MPIFVFGSNPEGEQVPYGARPNAKIGMAVMG